MTMNRTNTQQRHKLIDGDFSPEQATRVLLSLVKSKIDFHNVEKLSNEERFGWDVTHSERRVEELHQLHDTLRTACRTLAETGTPVHIKGWIEIQPVATPPEAGSASAGEPSMPESRRPQQAAP